MLNKKIKLIFDQIQNNHPNLSSFMVFQEVCKLIKFKRYTIEVYFLALVYPYDYEIGEEDYKASDEEFKKEFPSTKDYNEKMQNQLVANLLKIETKESKIKTISGFFIPPLNDEMKKLKRRINEGKFNNKSSINLYL
jgi:hypothetical protein